MSDVGATVGDKGTFLAEMTQKFDSTSCVRERHVSATPQLADSIWVE